MANYPAFFTIDDSTATPENGMEPERASNGALRLRRLWTADKRSFEIGHVLTPAEKTTLDSFYATNRDLDVTYRWPGDGSSYTVRFVAPPRYTPRGGRFEVRVRLMEV